MRKKLALLVMLLVVFITGCHKDKPTNSEEAVQPTEVSTEAEETEMDIQLNIENQPDSDIELPTETAPEPIMLIPGSNGEAVEITGDMTIEDISDPVAKENYKQIFGLQEDAENTMLSEEDTTSDENNNSTIEETISHEQYIEMEQEIRAYTDKQAEDLINEVLQASEGGQ